MLILFIPPNRVKSGIRPRNGPVPARTVPLLLYRYTTYNEADKKAAVSRCGRLCKNILKRKSPIMPDTRKHRGPSPKDAELFCEAALPMLRSAANDLAWLLDRGYGRKSAIALVGDRYDLVARQRTAVSRSVCSLAEKEDRAARMLDINRLSGVSLRLDGYNVLTTVEAALAGGILLECRDATVRDMASMHGTWRKVEETELAIRLLGEMFDRFEFTRWIWLLDRPVSGSGDLAKLIRRIGSENRWNWEVETPDDADRILIGSPSGDSETIKTCPPAATADSNVLDHCGPWVNLAAETISIGRIDSTMIRLIDG